MEDTPPRPPAPDSGGTEVESDPELAAIEAGWQGVLERWEDDLAHKKFLALVASLDRLPEAGKRYRVVRDSDPDRRDEAIRRIDLILAFALQKLELTRSPAQPSARKWVNVVALALSAALVVIGLISLLNMLRGPL